LAQLMSLPRGARTVRGCAAAFGVMWRRAEWSVMAMLRVFAEQTVLV
jgi:hypothetical protein